MHQPPSDPQSLSADTVHRLLGMALPETRNPALQAVVERLAAPDGDAWFESVLQQALEPAGLAPEDLREGRISSAAIRDMRTRAKSRIRSAKAPEPRLAATVIYYVCTAAALAFHGDAGSSATRTTIDPVLEQLVDALPEGWAELALRALEAR